MVLQKQSASRLLCWSRSCRSSPTRREKPSPGRPASKAHLFVADKANIAIRKVDLKTGMVTTFAGRGPGDPRGEPRDGKALEAGFHPGGGPNTTILE